MKLGKYKHYKGEYYYDVFAFALDSDTDKKMVLYRPLYNIPELAAEFPDGVTFTRDADIFFSSVVIDGKETPRFVYIGEIS